MKHLNRVTVSGATALALITLFPLGVKAASPHLATDHLATDKDPQVGTDPGPTNAASPAAASGPDAEPSPLPQAVKEIVVTARRRATGSGRPRDAGDYRLTSQDWSDVLSGTNALALAKSLPGVSFTSTDAYGLDQSDANLLMRGFRGNELAYMFEGIPLNDGSYGSVTGTSALSIGVQDNIAKLDIAPGAARVSTFSTTANGGDLRYGLEEVSTRPSGFVTLGTGSHNTQLATVSGQTGTMGSNGPRLLVGFQSLSKSKYTGAGTQSFVRGNLKLVQDLPIGAFSVFVSYGHAEIWGYNNTSFDMLNRLGWSGTDIIYPNYQKAYEMALPQNAQKSCGAYLCGELASLVPYDTGQATTDVVGAITQQLKLSDTISAKLTFYGARNDTKIGISDVSTPSLTGAPFSQQVWQPSAHRYGMTIEATRQWENHELNFGAWYEQGVGTSQVNWYNEPLLGQGAPLKTIGPYTTYGPAFQSQNASHWKTSSLQVYVEDVIRITPQLTATLGLKGVMFVTKGGGTGPDLAPKGRLVVDQPLLPHASLSYRPSPRSLVFLDVSGSTSAYRISPRGNIGPVSSAWAATDQDTFDAARKTLRPERDWNLTLGAFHNFGPVKINADLYYTQVLDRLLNGTTGPQFAPIRSVGTVSKSEILGADLTLIYTPTPWLSLSQSASISKFRYLDDLKIPGKVIPLRGKFQPGYPGASFISEIKIKAKGLETGLTSTVYKDQPFTYSNDIRVPDYWIVNAFAAYRLKGAGYRPDLILRLDVNNLLDRKLIGTTGIGGFSVSGDYQTFMRSAPRQVLLSLRANF